MYLSDMKRMDKALILDFEGLEKDIIKRFFDMGIAIGSQLVLREILNFRRLFLIRVDEADFCIRHAEAAKIRVELL